MVIVFIGLLTGGYLLATVPSLKNKFQKKESSATNIPALDAILVQTAAKDYVLEIVDASGQTWDLIDPPHPITAFSVAKQAGIVVYTTYNQKTETVDLWRQQLDDASVDQSTIEQNLIHKQDLESLGNEIKFSVEPHLGEIVAIATPSDLWVLQNKQVTQLFEFSPVSSNKHSEHMFVPKPVWLENGDIQLTIRHPDYFISNLLLTYKLTLQGEASLVAQDTELLY